MCEWEGPLPRASATLPDANANGSADLGLLTVNAGNILVTVKDGGTGAAIQSLDFGKSGTGDRAATGLAYVTDMNGNGAIEIAVGVPKGDLYDTKEIRIRDLKSKKLLKTIRVGAATVRITSMSTLPDMNGNGVSELSVMVANINDGTINSLIYDPKTGQKLKTIGF